MPEISRRAFGGLVGGGAATALAGTATAEAAEGTRAAAERPFRARPADRGHRRPNVLFILADDLGWADLSAYGAPHIRTPHLDRLAAQGVRFTNGYAGSATCSHPVQPLHRALPRPYPRRTRRAHRQPHPGPRPRPPPDEVLPESPEPHAPRAAVRQTVSPTVIAAVVRRLRRPGTWLIGMFMLKPFRDRRRPMPRQR
ncbi:hypothetical protein SGLAM104S_04898 [Streptomyces glaucescens]